MSKQLIWQIIRQFSTRKCFGFDLQDVLTAFPDRNQKYLSRIIAEMVKLGILYRIRRNSYHIIPFDADPLNYVPDKHRVAKYLVKRKGYYFGYATALEIHGLSLPYMCIGSEDSLSKDQNPERPITRDRVYVITKKQMRPGIMRIGEITYQFIQHDAIRFFGSKKIWINPQEKGKVSDMERTIVDICEKPQYSGGIIGVADALYQSKDKIDHIKLFHYFARNGNKTAMKRFLFLTELLGLGWTIHHKRMMVELGSAVSLLDPEAPVHGRNRNEFKLKINVNPTQIKQEVVLRNYGIPRIRNY